MDKKSLLNDDPKNLASRFHKAMVENGINVDEIIMFGSYAKNTARPDSDLDLCVVSASFGVNAMDELMLLSKISSRIDPLIEAHPYTQKDLENKYDPLAKEIIRTGIRLI